MTDEVYLTVPKGYALPDLMRQLAPGETAACLNYLAKLVGTFRKTTENPPAMKELLQEIELRYQNEKEKELQTQRLSLIDKHEQNSILMQKQNDLDTADLRHKLDLKTQEMKTLVENHKKDIETLNKTHEKDHTLAHKQAELCQQAIQNLDNAHTERTADLQNRINDLREQVQRHQNATNTSQGQQGELQVAELFKSAMRGTIESWDNTTTIESSGDAKAIILRNDQLYTVLIESKNVKCLHSKHDIEKFHKDIAKQKPDCALMISVQDRSVPNLYKLECIEGIPAMTIVGRCEHVIRLCMDHLIFLAQSKRNQKDFKDAARFSQHIDHLFTCILDLELSLPDKFNSLEAMRKHYDSDKKRISQMKVQMDRFLNMYPAHTAKSTMDLAVDEIKPDLHKKSDYVQREQLDLFNQAGGFPAVKAEYQRRGKRKAAD